MDQVKSGEDLSRLLLVSRETQERLEAFSDLLIQWQKRINLVSSSTLDALWQRHIWDSAQLLEHLPAGKSLSVLDMGAGAGFPSLVLGALCSHRFTLVESDGRKCSFLRQAVRTLDLRERIRILNQRIESVPSQPFDVITCRAFAPLSRLLDYGIDFADDQTVWLLPKGHAVEEELTTAALCWTMNSEKIASRSDVEGTILKLRGVKRV